jgi:predicted ribosome quality control (RQC) complex YloA/Tae2 family protein
MVIDSGFRCHLTDFTRATASAPSQFVTRLRKYLRSRRVTSIVQVGTDRVIEFQFSDGQYHLFLEFYAGGNILLTDKDLGILSLLRIVPAGEEQEELRIGLKYSIENRQNYNGIPTLTKERVLLGLRKTLDKVSDDNSSRTKKSKKKTGDALRKALSTSLNEFPPMLVDHALRVTGFDSGTPIEDVVMDDALLEKLMLALREAQRVTDDITSSNSSKGYIIAMPTKSKFHDQYGLHGVSVGLEHNNLMYEDFHPFRPAQFQGNPDIQILEFDGFNKTVNEFFSSIEGQKLESRLAEREENAKRKLDAARQDHDKRIGGLQQVQELNVRKAQAIEANLQKVQEAINAVNGLIAQGMDWVEIARLIEMEQARQNVVAEMINVPLKLYENTATLLLAEADYGDEEDFDGDETGSDVSDSEDEQHQTPKPSKITKAVDKRLAVDVDLALSPWSNARQYYDQKKNAAVKEQKTLQSSSKALKSTERKITADLKKGLKQEKQVLRPIRRQLWFEKFLYFISSEGYLVLGGKDAQQAEILYRRYLKKGDVYVHADLQGAASVVIKNKPGLTNDPIPPSTLSQAGTLTVASSTAWDSKAVMSAWWVDSAKVSKTAPNGDFLAIGNFEIRGQKNFLPPAQLLLGFSIMFHISEESKAQHLKHRFQGERTTKNNDPEDVAEGVEEGIEDGPRYGDNDQTDSEIDQVKSKDNSYNERPFSTANDEASDSAENEDENDSSSELGHDNPLQPDLARAGDAHMPEAEGGPAIASGHGLYQSANTEPSESERSEKEDSEGRQEGSQVLAVNSDRTVVGVRHDSAKEQGALSSSANVSQPSQAASRTGLETAAETFHPAPSLAASTLSEKPASSLQAPPVRGKHGKRNKLKTKYANQDEEDRALALRLLGSAAEQKTTDDAAARLAKEQELAAQKERRRQQHAIAAAKGKEVEEIRRANFEEGIDEEEEDEVVDLEAFVGTPLPGDEILDALVVCGPWDAVGARCRWRAKLQPGTTKKGKAVREILGVWTRVIGDWEKRKKPAGDGVDQAVTMEMEMRRREGELIKGIKDTEVVGVVAVGKCRVLMGGERAGRGKGGGAARTGKRGGRGSKKQR